ncbi:MAG: glycoside hydrolase family 3 protein [Candidatus Coatesbacteria bacterium]|nr:glycoside hydrolase family 3 protein [Candidatus Coatesbacteria bacterium]
MTGKIDQNRRAMEKLIAGMSVERLVGQLLVTGFAGLEVPRILKDHIDGHRIGGVIVFKDNIFDADQTQSLTQSLQDAARAAGEELPMLVMIDQEGGTVTRLDFLTMLPSAMALGAADSPSYAYLAGEVCGKELRALGFNVNCAPVLDVLTNPRNSCIGTRSFGGSPERVAELGAQYINGLQSADVMAVAKHFPGLGAASSDTHHGPARIEKTLDELLAFDLVPFRRAFEYGVAMVMATHAEYPKLPGDASLPASLSTFILTDLLRGDLDFRGPAASDDLGMGAISARFRPEEAAIKALGAGADILLFCHNVERIGGIHSAIVKAVKDRTLPAERVLEAATRVLWLKADLRARRAASGEGPSLQDLDLDEHNLLVHEIAEGAVCVVKDEPGLLPVDAETKLLVVHPRLEDRFNLPPPRKCASIYDAMLDYFEAISEVCYDREGPSDAQMAQIAKKSEKSELVVLCTFSAARSKRQLALCKLVLTLNKPCVHVALDEPFDLNLVEGFGTAIATFGFGEPTVRALASILAGASEPGGVMPVATP